MRLIGPAFAAALAASGGTALASDADFKLVNRTGFPIDEVYVSPHASRDWGGDRIGHGTGQATLGDGEAIRIAVPHAGPACRYDIQVKYRDGNKADWGDVDLCGHAQLTLRWDGKHTHAVGE